MKKQAGADRRGFLAMLGLGSVAGPGLVKDAITEGNSFNTLGRLASAASDDSYEDDEDMEGESDNSYSPRKNKDNMSDLHKERIKNAVKSFNDAKKQDYIDSLPIYIKNVRRLDSDLLSNRSLSVYARLRLQAIRNAKEDYETKLNREENYIHAAVKRARSFLSDNECFDLIASNIIRDKAKPLPTMEAFLKVIGPRKDKG